MRTSDAGISLIKRFEGLRLSAYPDPGTNGEPYTIGYGHTSRAGPPAVKMGMKISNKEAEAILRDDLKFFEDGVARLLKRDPTPVQFDAMVSLAYNIGLGNFQKSTVLRKFNAGDFAGAADAFMLFNKAGGKVMQGLVNRRNAERELFLIGSGKHDQPDEAAPKSAVDAEPIQTDRKPIYKHRRVWASVMGWMGGGGVATFASFSGFDWRTLAVLIAAAFVFVLFFWFIYRNEIRQGLFSK